MSATWGNKIRYTIFGESHGKGIGITIDGLPPGLEIDLAEVTREMERRAPGKSPLATARNEKDRFTIWSGFINGKTTGTPLCAIIENQDQKSADYDSLAQKFRPGHADYSGFIKYKGFNDIRGGGHFSGRLTAPLVFAGAIAKQFLWQKNIQIGAHIQRIASISEPKFNPLQIEEEVLKELSSRTFPVIDSAIGQQMQECILSAKSSGDSVGGIIEGIAINLPAGYGDPFFDSVESTLSHLLFSIPAIKGVEFGDGFSMAEMRGSMANDAMSNENGIIKTTTNHNGGILGGITNGMPLIFRVAVKPTPSIHIEQQTVNAKGENVSLVVGGRHDPCIVQRAVPVVEAVTAMAILDIL
ncbi:chorismate synthase [Pelosinus sp. sgz500959]|uniref:chorismate synthase n=1 Tax=Pelosinus sp. sgz500959 TaxID=3242472 RepID=UPI00367238EA